MEKYHKNQQIIDGELDQSQVMMHLETGKYFGLNPVGKRIWELIEQPKSFFEITQLLLAEFETTEEQCSREVTEFLEKVVTNGIVIREEMD